MYTTRTCTVGGGGVISLPFFTCSNLPNLLGGAATTHDA